MARSSDAKREILLETGTNELEIITLYLQWHDPDSREVKKTNYGINAAKVRELVAMPNDVTEVPDSPPSVRGVFLLRGRTIPLVDLCHWFGYDPDLSDKALEKWVVIVTEINGKPFGFISHGVDKVYRVSWTQIQPPPEMIAASHSITGVCLVDNQLIQMVDFENITASIDSTMAIQEIDEEQVQKVKEEQRQVVIADDSHVILTHVSQALVRAGYKVVAHSDGQAAWDYLEKMRNQGLVGEKVLAVISDIEMPRMDGLHLCMRIKQDPVLKKLPVILFSSLINDALRLKGEKVGADDQITKPELNQLVNRMQACIEKYAS